MKIISEVLDKEKTEETALEDFKRSLNNLFESEKEQAIRESEKKVENARNKRTDALAKLNEKLDKEFEKKEEEISKKIKSYQKIDDAKITSTAKKILEIIEQQ